MADEVLCPYCGKPAKLVTGADVYPHIERLASRMFWRCRGCDAHVGCHEGTSTPFGRLANAELRRARQRAHEAFDPLWKGREMSRRAAYAWLAAALKIDETNCHIGMFDVADCERVVSAVLGRRGG